MIILGSYIPFVDPIDGLFDAHRWWFVFLLPIALFIAMAYKAVRVPSLRGYAREVVVMTAHIVLAIVALGAGAYIIIGHVMPLVMPRS